MRPFDLRAQTVVPSAQRTDTPTQLALVDVSSAPITARQA
jgi:hypothetical protein